MRTCSKGGRWAALCVLLLLPGLRCMADEVEDYKQKAIAWSQQLQSFRGSYTVTQDLCYIPDPLPDDFAQHKEFAVEYRFQGENIYMQRQQIREDGTRGDLIVSALLGGKLSTRLEREHPLDDGALGEVRLDIPGKWPWPPCLFLMPHEFFRQTHNQNGLPLAESLAVGTSYVIQRSGQTVLSHWTSDQEHSNEMEIWFDEEGRVSRIDYLCRFFMANIEAVKRFWDDDPFEFGFPTLRFEFFNLTELNGLLFPADVRLTVPKTATGEGLHLIEEFKAGRLPGDEYMVSLCRAAPHDKPSTIREFHLDLDTAQANVPIPDEDFKVTYAKGDYVWTFGDEEEVLYRYGMEPKKKTSVRAQPWLLGSVVVAIAGAIAIVVWMRRARMKRR